MQETKTAEQRQNFLNQDSARQQHNELGNRYGKIGISAVVAALRHHGEQQSIGEYRIPFDRD